MLTREDIQKPTVDCQQPNERHCLNLVRYGDVPWLVAVGANEASGGGGGGGKEAGRGGDWCWSRRQDNFLQS